MFRNEDIKSLICDESYDPIVRIALEDLLMGMESDEMEECLWQTYLRGEELPVLTRTTSVCFDFEDKENVLPQGWMDNIN